MREGFGALKGKTLTKIDVDKESERVTFTTDTGEVYLMWHSQDCCESVTMNEVIGSWDDLIGSPILEAEETVEDKGEEGWSHQTWTFYKLGTIKGHVNLRWVGESNGYYSESVDFELLEG